MYRRLLFDWRLLENSITTQLLPTYCEKNVAKATTLQSICGDREAMQILVTGTVKQRNDSQSKSFHNVK